MSGLGIVLAGGAARGAYEAGVLRYVFGDLSRRLGAPPWPDVVSGTSVGALNSTFVAARDAAGIDWLAQTWREMTMDKVIGLSYGDLFRAARKALAEDAFAVADPRPLQRLVMRNFPSEGLRRAIETGGVTFVVGSTDLVTGRQVLFVDSQQAPRWPLRPGVEVVHTKIRSLHTLASGALPLLFPPIPLDGRLLVDGGVRQNTPLGPVIRAGADRVLVVSLKRQSQDLQRPQQAPNLPFLVGKLLNALLLDPVELDLFEAQQVNELIDWGVSRFGPEFAASLERDRGQRRVETLFMAPSEDLGLLAADIYRRRPQGSGLHGAAAQMLERAAGRTGPDADLLSYLYFDKAFTAAIEQLGFEDAKRQEEALARLLAPRT